MFQIRMTRLRALAATSLLSLSLAAPALADHRDWDDGYQRGYPVHRHDRHCDHDGRGGYWGDRGGWDRRGWEDGYRYRERRYGCGECGRRFRSENDYYRHVRKHHGFPRWAFPRPY